YPRRARPELDGTARFDRTGQDQVRAAGLGEITEPRAGDTVGVEVVGRARDDQRPAPGADLIRPERTDVTYVRRPITTDPQVRGMQTVVGQPCQARAAVRAGRVGPGHDRDARTGGDHP